jgi:hypothetical protein
MLDLWIHLHQIYGLRMLQTSQNKVYLTHVLYQWGSSQSSFAYAHLPTHFHLHYAWMPLLITKIIKNEIQENKEPASPCWSPSAMLHGRCLEIFCLLRMAVNSCEVPVYGKKWVTLYFARMSAPTNTEHAESEDWLYCLHSQGSSRPRSSAKMGYIVGIYGQSLTS